MRRFAPLLLACLTSAACARAIAVQSGNANTTYSIEVANQTGVSMVVSYNDGRGDAILGTVAAGRTERYIIASPAATTVSIRGVATSGSRTAGPYSVSLNAGSSVTVTLR